jgi:hypothetical protein
MKRRLTLALVLPLAVGLMAIAGAMHVPGHTSAAASTPPPPPTFVPTPIGSPPLPPTPTPTKTPIPTATPIPTNTPAPTATSAPLGAPARIVQSASVHRQGKLALVHWKMAFALGIKGFRIYSGHTLLTKTMIRPHHSPNYSIHVPWVKGGKYSLLVLFKNGHSQRISIS